jgi:hypothetical protein
VEAQARIPVRAAAHENDGDAIAVDHDPALHPLGATDAGMPVLPVRARDGRFMELDFLDALAGVVPLLLPRGPPEWVRPGTLREMARQLLRPLTDQLTGRLFAFVRSVGPVAQLAALICANAVLHNDARWRLQNQICLRPALQSDWAAQVRVVNGFSIPFTPGYYREHLSDALAVCCRYGLPSAMVTVTMCLDRVPQCYRDCFAELAPGMDTEASTAQPMCYAFRAQIDALLAGVGRLFSEIIGNKVTNLQVTIEAQGRGVLHAHIILWLLRRMTADALARAATAMQAVVDTWIQRMQERFEVHLHTTKCQPAGRHLEAPCLEGFPEEPRGRRRGFRIPRSM